MFARCIVRVPTRAVACGRTRATRMHVINCSSRVFVNDFAVKGRLIETRENLFSALATRNAGIIVSRQLSSSANRGEPPATTEETKVADNLSDSMSKQSNASSISAANKDDTAVGAAKDLQLFRPPTALLRMFYVLVTAQMCSSFFMPPLLIAAESSQIADNTAVALAIILPLWSIAQFAFVRRICSRWIAEFSILPGKAGIQIRSLNWLGIPTEPHVLPLSSITRVEELSSNIALIHSSQKPNWYLVFASGSEQMQMVKSIDPNQNSPSKH